MEISYHTEDIGLVTNVRDWVISVESNQDTTQTQEENAKEYSQRSV